MPEAELRLAEIKDMLDDATDEEGGAADIVRRDLPGFLSALDYALRGDPGHAREPETWQIVREQLLEKHAEYLALPIDNRPTIECEMEDRHGVGITTIKTTHIPRPGDLITLHAPHVTEEGGNTDWRVRLVKWVEVPGPHPTSRGPFVPRLIVERESPGG
jgi:hypothetical protein